MAEASAWTWKRIVPFLVGGVLGSAILYFALRTPGEDLTAAGLKSAREVWRRQGPRDYRMTVDILGSQHGLHEITVRDGKVASMITGGEEVAVSVRDFWTVEGMFHFLEDELLAKDDPERVHGVKDPAQVVLRVQFDPALGYPRRFLRHVLGRRTTIRWEIRSFEASD